MKKKNLNNQITKNKKAYFDYEIKDTREAWIMFKWYETKSVRLWHVNLKWSYIVFHWNEAYIKWMHITPWKALSNRQNVEADAERKIFLHKKTIVSLLWKVKEQGFSVIPLELYFKGSLIKLRVWLAKWKKSYQKKQVLKERSMQKEAKVAMSKYI